MFSIFRKKKPMEEGRKTKSVPLHEKRGFTTRCTLSSSLKIRRMKVDLSKNKRKRKKKQTVLKANSLEKLKIKF